MGRTAVDDQSGAQRVGRRSLYTVFGVIGKSLQTTIVASFQLVVDISLHRTLLDQSEQGREILLCLIEMLVGQGRLCQNEIVFLSFGYGDGTLVGAAELIVFGIEEVEPGKRLEPVAPDGFLCTVEYTVFAVEAWRQTAMEKPSLASPTFSNGSHA